MEPQNAEDVKEIVDELLEGMIGKAVLAIEGSDGEKREQINKASSKQEKKPLSTSSGKAVRKKIVKSPLSNQSKVKSSLPARDPSAYEWKHTEPPHIIRAPPEACQRFAPRIKPRNYDVLVDSRVHQMQPTEYLIGYSNQFISIGMIKRQEDIQGQPLTMQFGNWKIVDGKDLCVGSTVIVKSFAQMLDRHNNKPKMYPIKYSSLHDLINEGCAYSNVQAVDWAIVSKPKVISSIGRVKEMTTEIRPGRYIRLIGTIYDYEYTCDYKVLDDFWPMYIKEAPEKDSAVIVRWIEMKEPYSVFIGRNGLSTILPEYARNYLNLEKREADYIVGWVDTKFNHD